MSAAANTRTWIVEQPWRTWTNQALTIARIDLRRGLFSRRAWWVYLMAFAPVALIGAHWIVDSAQRSGGYLEEDTKVLAGIFQIYYMRLGIFFACMGIFTWLFRGEVAEKSLHYQFLVPVRREVLVLGKFLSGAFTAFVLFETAVFSCFMLMYMHYGPLGSAFIFDGPGMRHLWMYLLVTALACVGYGSVFLALSLVFRNPIIPGLLVMAWEAINPIMPAILQKLSVAFYLRNLCPVQLPAEGLLALFTVVATPVPAVVAVLGLLCVTAAVIVFACLRIRTFEITYSTD